MPLDVTCLILAGVLAIFADGQMCLAEGLTFDSRVEAQSRIERVYHRHRGDTRPFEQAVPNAVLEGKVRRYLQQSVALERFWGTPVTAEMLEREMLRMVRASRMSGRLGELFAALGEDTVLVQECLARPVLVDRLVRSYLARDDRVQTEPRRVAEELRGALEKGRVDAHVASHRRNVVEYVLGHDGPLAAPFPTAHDGTDSRRVELDPREFEILRRRLDGGAGVSLSERHDAFLVETTLKQDPSRIVVAGYEIPKVTWDDWWGQQRVTFDADRARTVARAAPQVTAALRETSRSAGAADSPCRAEGTWDNGILDDLPTPRDEHTAIWTGSEMLVWGGSADPGLLQAGARYDPATDTWTPMSTVNAPTPRKLHTAVWTGDEMIVWGGSYTNTGARYSPESDTWVPVATSGAPQARQGHSAFWTGSRMLVWGGHFDGPGTPLERLASGGLYDPRTDTWSPISTEGLAPRVDYAAVWTGSEMLVWGGRDTEANSLNTGLRYRPSNDTWTPMSTVGAPSPRWLPVAVWSGSQMVLWGGKTWGNQNPGLQSGARYSPATDTWSSISLAGGAPQARERGVWAGNRLVVWGPDPAGGIYNPSTNHWSPISSLNAPDYQLAASAISTGDGMIFWGGHANPHIVTNLGGRYNVAANVWTPMSIGVPSIRNDATVVWSGAELLVWGGVVSQDLDTGSRYDPLTDSWKAIPLAGAPSPRGGAYGIWTGRQMIVWAGSDTNTGALFDPSTETWTTMSTIGAPTKRLNAVTVWTGSEMILWGGDEGGFEAELHTTGGRYNPTTDTWRPTSAVGAPSGRIGPSAVWTGKRMIVWGGRDHVVQFRDGGEYDPILDTWTPTTEAGAPIRAGHRAVWTGSEMLVWGGFDGESYSQAGVRYDPVERGWSPMAISGAPDGRERHTVVWTGREMVVWGGFTTDGPPSGRLNSGARYDPVEDAWASVPVDGAPTPRRQHTAMWTGQAMLIWGGEMGSGSPAKYTNDGGRFYLGNDVDDDGDGLSECAGDCNDGLASAYPGAQELCDGLDQDCNGAADDGDADGDGYLVCEDCDDTRAGIFPGVTEICDGLDNDCDGAIDEGDADGDGMTLCFDCNDAQFTAPVGGRPGDVYGPLFGPDKDTLTWEPVWVPPGTGVQYDVVRGALPVHPIVGGEDGECLGTATGLTIFDPEEPPPGNGFWYLVRAVRDGCPGTYGFASNGIVRYSAACGP